MQIGEYHIYVLGTITTALVAGINWYARQHKGKTLHRRVLTVIVFVISVVLAWAWVAPQLPSLPPISDDPAAFAVALATFLGLLIKAATAILGAATVIYNLLLQKMLDRMTYPARLK